jgi:hypothetical protein
MPLFDMPSHFSGIRQGGHFLSQTMRADRRHFAVYPAPPG